MNKSKMQSHISINSGEVSSANNIVRVPCATGCIDIRDQNRTSGPDFENCSSSFDSRRPRRKRHRCISSSSDNQVEEMSNEYRETDGLLSSTRHNYSHRSVELQQSSDNVNPNLTDSNSSHCHDASERSEIDKKARTKLIIASLLCLIFMVGEMAGGLIAHSLAIISDAAHLLTDFASFMISLLALYLASRRATKKLSFGWYRVEILGALISILMLWVLTGILVYSAVNRIIDKSYEIDATVMLITASCGVAFNLALGFTLHQGGHTHSHLGGGHSHNTKHSHDNHSHGNKSVNNGHHDNHADSSPEEIRARYGSIDEDANGDYVRFKNADESKHRQSNINVKAAFVHVIGDLCQSIGVLIAALIIYFKPEWKMADPICTFLFSIFVIVTTITILRDILVVLMEGTPRHLIFTDIRDAFYEVEGVKDIHNLRVWSLTMDKTALSVHIAVYKDADPLKVLKTASGMIQSKFDIKETTMQIEEYVPEMLDCTYCQDLKD